MKKERIMILALLMIFISASVFSQDQIFTKKKEIIECKITEIGSEHVKYKLPSYGDDIQFFLETDQIDKVVFANGEVRTFSRALDNPDNYIDNKKNAVKVDFLSPLTGNTTFSYERSLKPGASIEATLGIIGAGFDPADLNAGGAFIRFGYKFIKSPDYYFNRMRYSHLLKGTYIKPEISLGYYSRESDEFVYSPPGIYSDVPRFSVFSGAIHLVVGKQWVINNAALVDFFVGAGYGFDDMDGGYHYGYVVAPSELPISASAGLKIGFLFD
jgi:hypothetical protein